jgi:hypothetical protein
VTLTSLKPEALSLCALHKLLYVAIHRASFLRSLRAVKPR